MFLNVALLPRLYCASRQCSKEQHGQQEPCCVLGGGLTCLYLACLLIGAVHPRPGGPVE